MNEVRQAWSSLRSPARTSSIVSNSNSNHGGSTTWYDVPVPVIIHCRNFSEDETASSKVQEEENAPIEKTAEQEDKEVTKTSGESEEVEEVFYENSVKLSSDSDNGKNDAAETHGEEVLYENNVEAALNGLVCTAPRNASDFEDGARDKRTERCSADETPHRRRLSSTVELKATTTVITNPDGVPVISFSFLQADDKRQSKSFRSDAHSEGVASDQPESTGEELYDTPKNTEDNAMNRNDADNFRVISDSRDLANTENGNVSSAVSIELYETPDSTPKKEVELAEGEEISKDVTSDRILTHIDSSRLKNHSEKAKSSSKSLKSGRRSYGASDNEAYDPGIASMTGSYSDPECPEETSQSSTRSKRLSLQKRRLGKAWGKMRCWLREEKSKIGDVVSRHAKLQAVGALNGESHLEENVKLPRGKCASYDLTRARTQELGSIPRVEEFGLTSVSEESHASEPERPRSKSPDSGKPSTNECSRRTMRSTLRKKTASSDDILGEEKRSRLACASFSLDKLCSDTENEEHVDGGGAGGSVEGGGGGSGESTSREHSGKGGLIKKRMLGSIRGLMASTHLLQTHEHEEGGQGGFEDVRRYIKQGGDFCKDLAAILHERAELEATYAKGLSKLSNKLTKACAKDQGGNSTGGVNEAWRCVGEEMEAAAEAHRVWGMALSEQLAKPLRIGVAEAQGRSRKSIENSVDKASKSLQEWRAVASKSKKQSFACARENERLQDLARLQTISQNQHNNNNKSSNHHMTEKEASKLESRRRKAEDSSRRADTEFYTVSVRAERARLEYENTVRKGAKQMELLEEERLSALKDFANVYLAHLQALAPRLQQSADRLSNPVRSCSVSQDVEILKNLIRRIDSNDTINGEQLLPDFYAEHVTLAMNRERRKQALVRILHLIRQDLERERRGREGLETLHRAFIKTPAFAADESTQNVTDKLHHMRSMLMYLEAARYKVSGTLAEVEGSKRGTHPLAEHILVSRDKQGLQQSVLKIPSWAKNESFEFPDSQDELEEHLSKEHVNEARDWADRTAGDGNSENPPDEEDFSDFDDFSSQSEDNNNQDVEVVDVTAKAEGAEQCRAIYQYSANLNDELSLSPGDLITIHQKQADGWWIGECRGRTGIFPATYVQVIH